MRGRGGTLRGRQWAPLRRPGPVCWAVRRTGTPCWTGGQACPSSCSNALGAPRPARFQQGRCSREAMVGDGQSPRLGAPRPSSPTPCPRSAGRRAAGLRLQAVRLCPSVCRGGARAAPGGWRVERSSPAAGSASPLTLPRSTQGTWPSTRPTGRGATRVDPTSVAVRVPGRCGAAWVCRRDPRGRGLPPARCRPSPPRSPPSCPALGRRPRPLRGPAQRTGYYDSVLTYWQTSFFQRLCL